MRAVLAVLFAFALATGALAADAVFPRGSAIGLVPPPGMGEAQRFGGFEDRANQSSILLVEFPAEAFDDIASGFTDQALAAKGVSVETREDFAIPGTTKAILATGTQQAPDGIVRKWVLLARGERVTALATVQVPEKAAVAYPDTAVRDALKTIAFRSADDQVKALPFSLNELSGFRVIRTPGGATALLTAGPKDVIDPSEQPYFVVSIGPGVPREDERPAFARRAMASVPGVRELRLERAEPLRISNQTGFEVIANAKDAKTGDDVKIIQWLRFGPNAYMRMVGVTRADAFAEAYPRMRAIRDGIEPR